ncbi:MAG: formate dehydrogenase subunit gamma [Comamonadaceae bacterium CG_4_9_14_0_8_um_filter_57_21]|nr:formate dehydrogenase subunit gamma [Rhodoferax sp.]NCS61815.1 formate dehydrogenase subunit gamma [Rhodoferax sp.]OIP18906.1 MAG: formate dehydrogenase subunit gamma [Comamonadaceae bacterium CG2_30_57_122]PIZ23451.1 MAG: formate dehydrogenase subunit gamma [Comamonadaceae bacterium CG_4_10_14_0_8_um_filter_57_29]PJC15444.1 MAG: formate dehydrogenase subunit gamma [Comamonadaceae bacterium CG_4_9_14_0_8_um_filter_57_21]
MKTAFTNASALLAALLLCSASAWAQTAPAAESAPASAMPGIQSMNIADVKPDASADPGYATQTNGERARVQPGNNAPMWRQVGSGVAGFSSLPKSQAPEAGVLIQPFVQYPGSRVTNAGEAWRQVRNNWLIPYGGSLLLIVLGAIALFHFKIGPMKVKEEPTGRLIERFSAFERSAHWANVAAFLTLAVSGVVMAFGKFFLLPVIGTTLFGWLSYALKNAHNFAGPLFAVSLLVVIVTFMRDNMPAKGDLTWLLKGGGIFSGHEVDSARYNAGEKVVFWVGVFALGLTVVVSGLAMDKLLPGLSYDRSTMQIAHMVHSVATLLMMVMMMGHIYLGSLGTKGALEGMRTGYVDETWAEQHHKLWFDDIKAGRIPAQRTPSAQPAGKPVQV